MRILFITATRIGDAVLSTGILQTLLTRHPTARLTIACGPAAAGLFTHTPNLERLLILDKQKYDAHWLGLWSQTCTTWWDLVVDLRGSALSFALPTRRRLIMRGGRRPGHRLAHLAGILNLAPPPLPVVWTAPEDAALARSLLPPGPPIVALGPSANWQGKIWPAERFVALFHALAQTRLPGARAAILAGPGPEEAARAQPLRAALPGAIDLAGALTLPQAAACLQRAALFVGNDSGLMHLAAAAGTPTLGLFGPTSAQEYAPAGRRTAVALADGPPGAAPMDHLTVATALHAALTLLDQAP